MCRYGRALSDQNRRHDLMVVSADRISAGGVRRRLLVDSDRGDEVGLIERPSTEDNIRAR
jgi:hypothetical protein